MQSSQPPTLTSVLTTLAQKLSTSTSTSASISQNQNQASPYLSRQQMIIKLLQKIDVEYFEYKFSLQQTYDYESIIKCIVDYYSEYKNERIKKIFLMQVCYVNKFQHIFQLVLDLAITYNQLQKQRYISEIINMNQQQKQVLMPYFSQVTKRKFIQKLAQFHKYMDSNQVEHTEQDQLLQQKDQEYNQLKQQYEELTRIYTQLVENHNNVKLSFQKVLAENSNLVQEKCQLMNQLGVHPSSGFLQICDKYKRDTQQFANYIQKLNKDIEQRNIKIAAKDAQIKTLSGAYVGGDKWQLQKIGLNDKIKKLQSQVKILETKEVRLRDELDGCKGVITKLKEDLEKKQEQVRSLIKIKSKYKGIKEVHLQFKKNFIQKMKQT